MTIIGRRNRTNRRKNQNLRCESLESRYLLTTFTVNSLTDVLDPDDGVTTLREAVNLANASPGVDDVEFDAEAFADSLFIVLDGGAIDITDSVNIQGLSNTEMGVRVDDPTDAIGDGSRLFNINDGLPGNIDVLIADLQFRDGDNIGNGGAIFSQESLTLQRIVGFSSQAGASGGFLHASLSDGATLVIDDSEIGVARGDVNINPNFSELNGGGVSVAVYGGTVNIIDSTITGNTANGDGGGLYIYSDGADNSISITNSNITNNDAADGGGAMIESIAGNVTIQGGIVSGNVAGRGGGVFGSTDDTGSVTISGALITGNEATDSGGGVGGVVGGGLTVEESRITDNISVDGAGVGLVVTATGTANVDSAAVFSNTATGDGGGVQVEFSGSGGTLNVLNSTVSGNSAATTPAVAATGDGSTSIRHSTIVRNNSDTASAAVGTNGSAVTISHSIVADQDLDVEVNTGTLDVSFSIIGTNAGSGLTESAVPDANGNLIGGAASIDVMLGDLGPNGGSTETHALLPGSPALDAGDPAIADAPALDQRRGPFIRVFDGDGDGTSTIDVGAYERISADVLIVDNVEDELDQDYSAGDLSLREAIALAADSVATTGDVSFAPELNGSTINLTLGEILINNSVVIQGPGSENLTISAVGNDPTPAIKQGDGTRVFNVTDGDTGRNLPVEISGLTLTGGDVTGEGGAVSATEDLLLKDAVLTGNHSALSAEGAGFDGDGGALWARTETGHIRIVNVDIVNNTSDDDGGGANVLSGTGQITIEDSDISGNAASGLGATGPNLGGGLRAFGDEGGVITVINTTISDNSGETLGQGNAWGGGGVGYIGSGTLVLQGSTVSGNTSSSRGGGIYMEGGSLELIESTVSDNVGVFGGGVANWFGGTSLIESSTIDGNGTPDTDGGGVINFGVLDIVGSTISANVGDLGGGVLNGRPNGPTPLVGTLNILSSTFSGNTGGFGGALFSAVDLEFTSSIRHTTITANTAESSAGGIYNFHGPLDVDHTIVAANVAPDGGASDVQEDTSGTLGEFVFTNSLIGDSLGLDQDLAESAAPNAAGNIVGGPVGGVVNPELAPLADNGGPTMTHALTEESPGLDNGDQSDIEPPESDQRGAPFVRVFNVEIDMGAYEMQPDPVTAGDFDADGDFDCDDIDALVADIRDQTGGAGFDLNNDGTTDVADIDEWLSIAGNANIGRAYLGGDANLDGEVNAADLNFVGQAWQSEVVGWCLGDFNADGLVNALDLNILGQSWQLTARAPRAPLSAAAVLISAPDSSREMPVVNAERSLGVDGAIQSPAQTNDEVRRSQRRQLRDQYRVQGSQAAESTVDESAMVDELFANWDM